MLTQLTYSGLIDDIFSIKNGFVNLPGRMAPKQEGRMQMDTPAFVKVPLNDKDMLFAQLRDESVYKLEHPLAHRHVTLLSHAVFSRIFGGKPDPFGRDNVQREAAVGHCLLGPQRHVPGSCAYGPTRLLRYLRY